MKDKKISLLIAILLIVIVVLAGVVLYAFVIRPAISGYVIRTQNQGMQTAVLFIMQQASPPQCNPVPLTDGEQTINVIAIECLQQAQNQQ